LKIKQEHKNVDLRTMIQANWFVHN